MFSKGLFQPSNSKNCFTQMEYNFTKMREVCIPNRTIFKKFLHVLHTNHRLGEFKRSSQVIFPEIYNFIIWVISFKGRFWGFWDDFGENKTCVFLGTWPITKPLPYFTKLSLLEICRRNFVVTVSIFRVGRFRIQG